MHTHMRSHTYKTDLLQIEKQGKKASARAVEGKRRQASIQQQEMLDCRYIRTHAHMRIFASRYR